jgi:hypothetical protein
VCALWSRVGYHVNVRIHGELPGKVQKLGCSTNSDSDCNNVIMSCAHKQCKGGGMRFTSLSVVIINVRIRGELPGKVQKLGCSTNSDSDFNNVIMSCAHKQCKGGGMRFTSLSAVLMHTGLEGIGSCTHFTHACG